MPTLTVAPGLFIWELEYADGTIRHALGSSLDTLINDTTPIVRALRIAAFDPDAVPVISSLNPTTKVAGSAASTLHVLGTGFRADSKIVFDGVELPTTLVSPTDISASIAPALPARTVQVEVVATASGQRSNAKPFTITATE